ncbi:3-hydroxyisobutyryl-CoA hydrolase, mitochondrial [Adelges cooleyi]|uniref:3-hydroxyisobutyryl-CoA hydrolase, mitochondrial n=1 Tax=Adelges cooleyi TaxID=133065 RepID=UPI00217F2DD2|nr:3-hydroxyisobutyryl-CoA hydrolase, mitochondrial [Adelges cooleyi]XP_050426186.1 3-hydroxyisobutyryl-CoA hydrolase, mitochondrial [Adelges cooleyi]
MILLPTRIKLWSKLTNCKRCFSTGMDDVLFEEKNNVGIITLNRQKALNALNESMVKKIIPKLKEYESKVRMVIVQGAGEKSFCAGGDVKFITENGPTAVSLDRGSKFFKQEYSMNSMIGNYKIPYISLIDGITMGGGVGISVHGKYRIATEKTLFAMPETAIGLFCDVGASHVLSRMEKHLGVMLGLTGYRLKGTDVVKSGIATHYVNSSKIESLKMKLIEDMRNPEIILNENTEDLSDIKFSLDPYLEKIDFIFSIENVEKMFETLEKDNSDWAQKILQILKEVSPMSLKITRKEISNGKNFNLNECLIMEHRLAYRCMEAKYSTDFYEGVRALLIDKDKSPKWSPASLKEIKDEIVSKYFEPLPKDLDLKFV